MAWFVDGLCQICTRHTCSDRRAPPAYPEHPHWNSAITLAVTLQLSWNTMQLLVKFNTALNFLLVWMRLLIFYRIILCVLICLYSFISVTSPSVSDIYKTVIISFSDEDIGILFLSVQLLFEDLLKFLTYLDVSAVTIVFNQVQILIHQFDCPCDLYTVSTELQFVLFLFGLLFLIHLFYAFSQIQFVLNETLIVVSLRFQVFLSLFELFSELYNQICLLTQLAMKCIEF